MLGHITSGHFGVTNLSVRVVAVITVALGIHFTPKGTMLRLRDTFVRAQPSSKASRSRVSRWVFMPWQEPRPSLSCTASSDDVVSGRGVRVAVALAQKVGIPKEVSPHEKRVAATPDTVKKIQTLGLEVLVEAGAGEGAHFQDGAYAEIGARVVPSEELWAEADRHPQGTSADDTPRRQERGGPAERGRRLVGFIWPGQNPSLVERLAQRNATVLAMDAVPRITRAQKMDALSAMANIVGYRAVIEAASALGRFLGGQMTAAGRVKPAQRARRRGRRRGARRRRRGQEPRRDRACVRHAPAGARAGREPRRARSCSIEFEGVGRGRGRATRRR